jgi:hypothetical protein
MLSAPLRLLKVGIGFADILSARFRLRPGVGRV